MQYTKAERTRNLRYKRPALQSLGYEYISNELYEIIEACSDIRWFVENENETLLNALDGNEEDEFEFRMAFSDLETKAEQLNGALQNWEIRDEFDDCTVALVGNRYITVGYDSSEEDYFSLTSYEQGLARTESGKRLMRHTKAEMISIIGQCFGITMAFLDLRQTYDYLKATFDILKDENTSLLQMIKEIDEAYEKANEDGFCDWDDSVKRFNSLIKNLPDMAWAE